MTTRDTAMPTAARELPDATEAGPSAVAAATPVPEATAGDLPAVLTTPPWEAYRTPLPELELTPIDEPARLCWRPGEREEWLRTGARYCWPDRWPALHEKVLARGRILGLDPIEDIPSYLLSGPLDVTLPWLREWDGSAQRHEVMDAIRAIVARYGLDALPLVRGIVALEQPELRGPFADPALVPGAVRAESPAAWAWLLRHPHSSAIGLVPIAVGTGGADRLWAGEALRRLAATGHRDTVLDAADRYGAEAAELVGTLLQHHPGQPPTKQRPLPRWLTPHGLPRVLLRGRRAALPADAVGVLLARCAAVRRGVPQPALAEVAEVCDPVSLAGFVNAILDRWRARETSEDTWVLIVAGLLGDDGTADRLADALLGWRKGAQTRMRLTVDALAAIGTEPGLRELAAVVLRGGRAANRAAKVLVGVAADRGVTTHELIDRLTPNLGLSADRTVTVDYGSRAFTVRFDHLLQPMVSDRDGRPRASLPRPGANDDKAVAVPAYQRFQAIRRDLTAFAKGHSDRLAEAMLSGRRWSGAAFRRDLLGNPIIRALADRLLWTIDGTVCRVAEDGAATDLTDNELAIPDGAAIGVAHPAQLGDALPQWQQVCQDYYLLPQPFDQLVRPVFRLAPGEALTDRLASYAGRHLRRWLDHRRWHRRGDTATTPLRDGRLLRIVFAERTDPGWGEVPSVSPCDDHPSPGWAVIRSATLSDPSVLCERFPDDPVFVSELILDLEALVAP